VTTRQVRRAAERKANKAANKTGSSNPQRDIDQFGQPIETEEELDTLIEEQHEALQAARLQREAEAKQKTEHPHSESDTPTALPNPKGGPRTPEGKAISSLNNLKHGLTGSFHILDNESQREFDLLLVACR
jgi:hypothetical protein